MSDPNNWITDPPRTIVQIHGTSRDSLNGQLGLVVSYSNNKLRYVTVLTKSPTHTATEPYSFKPENLKQASWLQTLQGHYQLVVYNPRVREELRRTQQLVQQHTGLSLAQVALLVLVVLGVLWYALGFARTLLLSSATVLVAFLTVPVYVQTGSVRRAVQQVPNQLRAVLMQSKLPFVQKMASSRALLGLVGALFVTCFVLGMMPPRQAATTARYTSYMPTWFNAAKVTTPDNDMELYYYKLGFDDAAADRVYGTSLPNNKQHVTEGNGPRGVSSFDFADDAMPPPPKLRRPSSSFGSIGTLMSAFVLFRTCNELGRDPSTGTWSVQRMMANAQRLPVWRLGLLGLSTYRIVKAILEQVGGTMMEY
jgi:hypothetical protein